MPHLVALSVKRPYLAPSNETSTHKANSLRDSGAKPHDRRSSQELCRANEALWVLIVHKLGVSARSPLSKTLSSGMLHLKMCGQEVQAFWQCFGILYDSVLAHPVSLIRARRPILLVRTCDHWRICRARCYVQQLHHGEGTARRSLI